jgi:thiol-disulfide isomerase/thioredoxin
MRRYFTAVLSVLCAGFVLAAPPGTGTSPFKKEAGPKRPQKDLLENKAPPELQVTGWMNTERKDLKLSDLKGKVVVLDFWGVWCPPCKAAIPKLKALYEKHKKDGLVIIGVHTKSQGDKMAAYVGQENIPYPVCIDSDGKTVNAFHVDSYPDYYLIDRNGILRVADLANTELENAINILLKEPTVVPASK